MLDGSQNASVQAEIIWLYMINVCLALVGKDSYRQYFIPNTEGMTYQVFLAIMLISSIPRSFSIFMPVASS